MLHAAFWTQGPLVSNVVTGLHFRDFIPLLEEKAITANLQKRDAGQVELPGLSSRASKQTQLSEVKHIRQ